jgi:hypothetical protein
MVVETLLLGAQAKATRPMSNSIPTAVKSLVVMGLSFGQRPQLLSKVPRIPGKSH